MVARLGRVTSAVDGSLVRAALVPFVVTRLPLILAGTLSVAMLPVSRYVESYWLIRGLDRVVDAFSRWDAWHYTRIAATGYPTNDPSRAAFFPLFPTLTRSLAELLGRTDRPGLFLAAVLVANVCAVLATMALIALARLDLDAEDADRSAWYLLCFPTALFLSAGYSEALFLALSVGAVLACRTDRWLTAGILAALAALTRPVGVLVAIPLVVEAVVRWRATRQVPWRALVGVVLPGMALLAWMGYLGVRLGDPLAFVHAQEGWNREVGPPWDAFLGYLDGRLSLATGRHSLTDLVFALIAVGGVVLSWRWLRPSYTLYMAALLVVPLATGSLVSMPRFVLVMFPLMLVFAILGRRPTIHTTLIAVGMGISGVYMALFAQWYWVA